MSKLKYGSSLCACERFENILRRLFFNKLQLPTVWGHFWGHFEVILLDRDHDSLFPSAMSVQWLCEWFDVKWFSADEKSMITVIRNLCVERLKCYLLWANRREKRKGRWRQLYKHFMWLVINQWNGTSPLGPNWSHSNDICSVHVTWPTRPTDTIPFFNECI